MTLDIRKAIWNDLEDILALYAEPDIDNGTVLDLRSAEAILEQMERYPNYTLYVAAIDNQVVGSFALLIMHNLAHMGASSAVVEDVVVNSKWRGQGVGSQMIKFAMGKAREAECYKIALSCSIDRDRAHKFYKSLGFERHGYSFKVKF